MGKLKVHELRTKNKGDLAKQLEELKTERGLVVFASRR